MSYSFESRVRIQRDRREGLPDDAGSSGLFSRIAVPLNLNRQVSEWKY